VRHSLAPRKRFGQNFLHDPAVLARIVAAIAPERGDALIEIGPGRGALTVPLLSRLDHLEVVELDRDLIPGLRALAPPERLTIHSADALEFDFAARASAGRTLRVVGNLPYNISTPLLFHLLEQAHAIQDMHFLLQKEVVERLVAAPGSKRYGRLGVMLGARAVAQQLFTVGPGAFRPAPKVESALVRIRPLATARVPEGLEPAFRRVVNQAFSNRRKTLRRALTAIVEPADIAAAGIDGNLRPEELDIDSFVALARVADHRAQTQRANPAGSRDHAHARVREHTEKP
jgi:16S rRNA (adenine1518-N6/adenine1519-N6)-dimethyltransferase